MGKIRNFYRDDNGIMESRKVGRKKKKKGNFVPGDIIRLSICPYAGRIFMFDNSLLFIDILDTKLHWGAEAWFFKSRNYEYLGNAVENKRLLVGLWDCNGIPVSRIVRFLSRTSGEEISKMWLNGRSKQEWINIFKEYNG